MGVDIDIYKIKDTLKRYELKDEKWLNCQDIEVAHIEVGTATKEVNTKLRDMGYKDGEIALAIIQ